MRPFLIEARNESEIIGDAFFPEILEDGEFWLVIHIDASAHMFEIMTQQVEIGTLEKEVVLLLAGFDMAIAFDLESFAPPPGEAHRAVERMQHGERDMDALQRNAGRGQPFATAPDDRFEIRIPQRYLLQPVRHFIDEDFRCLILGGRHAVLPRWPANV